MSDTRDFETERGRRRDNGGAGSGRASGDGGRGSTASSRDVKTNVEPVDPEAVLAGVEGLPVPKWEYRGGEAGGGTGVTHIGPMAEDFHDAFDVGAGGERINAVDAHGVALAAIKGLSARLDERDDRIDGLAAENAARDDRIDDLSAAVEDLRGENKRLRERLSALEAAVDVDGE